MLKRKEKIIYRVFQKKMFYVFAYISANTYSRETSRISTELSWQEASNDMRLSPLPGSRENWHFMKNFDPF